MEKYLIEQYDVFEDPKYLTKESEIIDYFMDGGSDYFDCGQGYFQDEANFICKIGSKFYDVTIYAEIASAKQDVGERLFWVDDILNVEYRETEKPRPKDKTNVSYNLSITKKQKDKLEEFMRENFIDYS